MVSLGGQLTLSRSPNGDSGRRTLVEPDLPGSANLTGRAWLLVFGGSRDGLGLLVMVSLLAPFLNDF